MKTHFACAAALLAASACGAETETRRADVPPTPVPPFAAAPAADAPPAAVPRSAPAPDPVLAPGDLLAISVFRQPDLQLEVRIPQEGKITYPLIGPVQAAGKTTAQLEQTLKQRLEKDFLHDPSVTVTVKEYAPRKVYVMGGVTKPGGYEVFPTSRLTLLQAIAAAEGLTDRAYKEYVQVVRRRGPAEREVLHVNLVQVERLLAQGHPEADLELWPDDLVVIPSAVRVAYVLGQVNKPGQVEVPNGARMTVSMAVSHAGSYTKFAATSRVMVLRTTPTGETRKYAVDLDAILNGRLELDLDLQPGDVVWVPERGIF
jgi:polysaccharide export outer membrane protein